MDFKLYKTRSQKILSNKVFWSVVRTIGNDKFIGHSVCRDSNDKGYDGHVGVDNKRM